MLTGRDDAGDHITAHRFAQEAAERGDTTALARLVAWRDAQRQALSRALLLVYCFSMSSTERTSVSLPVDLAEWARERSGGNVSGYIAGLIARDKRRTALMQLFEDAGYVGENAITEAGIARMGERLHALNARRAGKRTAA